MYTLIYEDEKIRRGVNTVYLRGRGYISTLETSFFTTEFFSNITQKMERIYSTAFNQQDDEAVFIPSARKNAKKEAQSHNERVQKCN